MSSSSTFSYLSHHKYQFNENESGSGWGGEEEQQHQETIQNENQQQKIQFNAIAEDDAQCSSPSQPTCHQSYNDVVDPSTVPVVSHETEMVSVDSSLVNVNVLNEIDSSVIPLPLPQQSISLIHDDNATIIPELQPELPEGTAPTSPMRDEPPPSFARKCCNVILPTYFAASFIVCAVITTTATVGCGESSLHLFLIFSTVLFGLFFCFSLLLLSQLPNDLSQLAMLSAGQTIRWIFSK